LGINIHLGCTFGAVLLLVARVFAREGRNGGTLAFSSCLSYPGHVLKDSQIRPSALHHDILCHILIISLIILAYISAISVMVTSFLNPTLAAQNP